MKKFIYVILKPILFLFVVSVCTFNTTLMEKFRNFLIIINVIIHFFRNLFPFFLIIFFLVYLFSVFPGVAVVGKTSSLFCMVSFVFVCVCTFNTTLMKILQAVVLLDFLKNFSRLVSYRLPHKRIKEKKKSKCF